MYTSIYLLAQSNAEKSKAYQGRWTTQKGSILKEAVLKHLRKGTVREFLKKEFAKKRMSILEHDKDLRGILLADEDLSNCARDALIGFDFPMRIS